VFEFVCGGGGGGVASAAASLALLLPLPLPLLLADRSARPAGQESAHGRNERRRRRVRATSDGKPKYVDVDVIDAISRAGVG